MKLSTTIRNLVFALALLVSPGLALAQDPAVLHRLPAAVERGYTNEEALDQDQSFNDPVKNRCGAWEVFTVGHEYYICARSGDLLTGDANHPNRWEKVLEAIKVDAKGAGMWELFLQDAGRTDDGGMKRKITVTQDYIEFHVPVKGVAALPVGAVRVGAMWSDDGHYTTQQQPDGNFVSYELARPFDLSVYRALWSSWGGKIDHPVWSDAPEGEAGRSWKHLWIW